MSAPLLLAYLHLLGLPERMAARAAAGPRDRGDVPGWVMITVMTAALVIAILGVFRDRITEVIQTALDGVTTEAGQ